MSGISLAVITHALSVNLDVRSVRQKKRKFALNRIKTVKEETNQYGFDPSGKNDVHYRIGFVLLQSNVVRFEKCRGDLPTVNE